MRALQSHRGQLIVALGALGWFLPLLSVFAWAMGHNDLEAMKALRRCFDPESRCNPHKIFPGSKRCADFAPRKQVAA